MNQLGTDNQFSPHAGTIRHSGIELLRLVSMLFIVALHINFYAFGAPSTEDLNTAPLQSYLRVFFESLAKVGVNCFILISGWFGIHPKRHRILELLYQCAFFCVLLYGAGWLSGIEFSRREALKNLFFLGELNWFIKSYLALYIIAPVLESFVSTASEKTYRHVLIAFFIFQSIYGWLFPVAHFFVQGFSAFSFMGLYLLARYIHLFSPRFASYTGIAYLYGYLVLVFLSSVAFVLKALFAPRWQVAFLKYSAPLVIAASVCLFLAFSKIQFQSSFVNCVAKSSYAIYLFHVHTCICAPLLIASAKRIITLSAPAVTVCIPLLLLSFMAAAILIDQMRIYSWKILRDLLAPSAMK